MVVLGQEPSSVARSQQSVVALEREVIAGIGRTLSVVRGEAVEVELKKANLSGHRRTPHDKVTLVDEKEFPDSNYSMLGAVASRRAVGASLTSKF